MNMGPCHDGTIMGIFQERLKQTGAWMKVNGQAIYGTSPWDKAQNDTVNPSVWYTTKDGSVYALFVEWPADNILVLGAPTPSSSASKVTMLGVQQSVTFELGKPSGIRVTLPSLNTKQMPCQWAWTLKLDGFQ